MKGRIFGIIARIRQSDLVSLKQGFSYFLLRLKTGLSGCEQKS